MTNIKLKITTLMNIGDYENLTVTQALQMKQEAVRKATEVLGLEYGDLLEVEVITSEC